LSEIKFAPLDVGDDRSIAAFAELLKAEHPAGIDIGALFFKPPDSSDGDGRR
jgi:hypothetical protein